MNAEGVAAAAAVAGAGAGACVDRFGETASPAFGGGGTGDCDCGALLYAAETGAAPGCGAAGDSEVVGRLVVGVAVRLAVGAAAAAVAVGRLGAAPGCAFCDVA